MSITTTLDREHFIPLRKTELIELLCAEGDLHGDDRRLFRQLCRQMTAAIQHDYSRRLEELKADYAIFDPDSDTTSVFKLTEADKQKRLNDLVSMFGWLMEKANFKHLSRDDLEPALHGGSEWGIPMDVDFGVFERLAMFVRGNTTQKRTRRRWRTGFRVEETDAPIYQRLVLMLKLRSHPRLAADADTEHVFLKIFKDIPQLDVKMLLPGAKVRLTIVDRSKIGMPLLSGLALALWRIGAEIVDVSLNLFDRLFGFMNNPTLALWGITTGAVGYGYRSYYGYQQMKQRYHLTLTQSLYYQNLDSNSGVLFRLLDEAEEQEFRETILAYYFLWRHAGEQGMTIEDLNLTIELFLERFFSLEVAFDIRDAACKLEALHLVKKKGALHHATPPEEALKELGRA
jgi:hypothetical protein